MHYLFTNRFGGVSKTPFDTLNLALHVKDDPRDVAVNRYELSKKIGIGSLVFMEQIHSDNIEIITNKNIKKVLKTDAMISNLKGIALCVMVADCLPILFYDKTKEVIAVAHAGRNGVKLKIANKTVQKMVKEFSCEIANIEVFIGAGIKSCCYEVKEDATQGFENYLHVKDKKIYLDITSKCVNDLKEIGIKSENIAVSAVCTCCNQDYFSYRRDGATGRFCGVIRL